MYVSIIYVIPFILIGSANVYDVIYNIRFVTWYGTLGLVSSWDGSGIRVTTQFSKRHYEINIFQTG